MIIQLIILNDSTSVSPDIALGTKGTHKVNSIQGSFVGIDSTFVKAKFNFEKPNGESVSTDFIEVGEEQTFSYEIPYSILDTEGDILVGVTAETVDGKIFESKGKKYLIYDNVEGLKPIEDKITELELVIAERDAELVHYKEGGSLADYFKVCNGRYLFDGNIKLNNRTLVTDEMLEVIPFGATKYITDFYQAFAYNEGSGLTKINLDLSSGTNFYSTFQSCKYVKYIGTFKDTRKVTNWTQTFSSCESLEHIEGELDLYTRTTNPVFISSLAPLKHLIVKNIRTNFSPYGGATLKLDHIINMIYECWDKTGTTACTLQIGSAGIARLANTYVKLIDITDEMRAEDEFIDNKKPFVVCESTDDGAMLITDYILLKNWILK